MPPQHRHLTPPGPVPRRHLLRLAGAGMLGALPTGLSLAASSTQADAPRLVVVMLRGALDGLAAVSAPGDPHWASLRPESTAVLAQPQQAGPPGMPGTGGDTARMERPGASDAAPGMASDSAARNAAGGRGGPARALDGVFALHPALRQLHEWYGQRQLLVLHAVASPYRERSHFDAQQMLESAGTRPFELGTGWLGRALQLRGHAAVALAPAMPVALRGASTATTWTPERRGQTGAGDLYSRVAQMYQRDDALAQAWAQAMAQQGLAQAAGHAAGASMGAASGASMGTSAGASMGAGIGGTAAGPGADAQAFVRLARQAGLFLAADAGPRVAWLETTGWDTHILQVQRLSALLGTLDDGLAALRQGLGAAWAHSTVLVMTEFGRSARYNGSGGTDHGTAGVALLAGGAISGGTVMTDWPGLAQGQLHEGRDLRPTTDLHAVIATVARRQFALSDTELAQVTPGARPLKALADRLRQG